jgi:peroxiredoxin
MQDRTETLKVGSRAPEFVLPSANWESSIFTLSTMLERGPVIVEFLRGTW